MKKHFIMIGILILTAFLFGCEAGNDILVSEAPPDTLLSGSPTSAPGTNSAVKTAAAETTAPTATASKLPSSSPAPTGEANNPGTTLARVQDYFPIKENVRYIYEGKGNEYAAYDVYIDYTSQNRVQQRKDNGGTVAAVVIQVGDGKVTQVFSRPEAYYRENFLKSKSTMNEVLLMEPLQTGTTWTLADKRVRTITNTSADVQTPSGSYKAIEVTTTGDTGKTIDYYAKDVGLVKSVFVSGDEEISSTLSKIEKDAVFQQNVRFFYPNIEDGKIYYKDKPISFKTNDITRKVLAEAYKEPGSDQTGKVFSKNTCINSLYLSKDGMVYIDLNKAFLTEMNAGSGYEMMILQSVANTFGYYYGADKVLLTIDNELYESGHIAMKKGEYLTVSLKDTVEIK